MSSKKALVSHAATIIAVSNLEKSISFYTDSLGFTLTFSYGEPTYYAILNREDAVYIHLSKVLSEDTERKHACLYIFVHDVDELYQEFMEKEIIPHEPIGDRDYGMRDFDVIDPDGNIITFGKGINN